MPIPTSTFVLIDSSTESGRAYNSQYQSDTAAVKVFGLSNDSVTIEAEFDGEGFHPIAGLEGLSEDGIYSTSPLPAGKIRASRSGNADQITVIVQRAS